MVIIPRCEHLVNSGLERLLNLEIIQSVLGAGAGACLQSAYQTTLSPNKYVSHIRAIPLLQAAYGCFAISLNHAPTSHIKTRGQS
jgi:hypothetical protein